MQRLEYGFGIYQIWIQAKTIYSVLIMEKNLIRVNKTIRENKLCYYNII